LLVRAGVLDESKLEQALARQARHGGRIGRILVQMEFVSEDVLMRALSKQLGVKLADIRHLEVPPHLLYAVDAEYAKAQVLCPLRLGPNGRLLVVAMSDPGNITVVDEVTRKVGMRVEPHLAGDRVIAEATARVYGLSMVTDSSESILLDNAGSVIDPSRPPTPLEHSWSAVLSVPSAPSMPLQPSRPPAEGYGGFAPGEIIASRTRPPPTSKAPVSRLPSLAPIAGDPTSPPSRAPSVPQAPSAPQAPAVASISGLEQVVDTLTDAQRQQLKAIRVMVDLLVARGVFSREEYLARLNRG
jgi:hypothetical protein